MRRATNTLTPHPRNTEFFNDIVGEPWQEFLRSVETSGVIEPVVITQDGMIVSGHQRVRACIELGITEVPVVVREYANEDAILKDLLETNLRQRGVDNSNPVKLGRCIKELERLYGIRNGGNRGNQYTELPEPQNAVVPKSQEDLAKELKMSTDKLQRYKKLADLIPELEDLIDTGMITPTTALALSRQLSQEDQLTLLKELDKDTRYTASQIQAHIDKLKKAPAPAPAPDESLKRQLAERDRTIKSLRTRAELAETRLSTSDAQHDAETSDLRSQVSKLEEENGVLHEQVEQQQEQITQLTEKQTSSQFDAEYYIDSFETRDEDYREVLSCAKEMQKALERFASLRFKRCMSNPSTRAGVEVIMRDLLRNYNIWVTEITDIFNTQEGKIIDVTTEI